MTSLVATATAVAIGCVSIHHYFLLSLVPYAPHTAGMTLQCPPFHQSMLLIYLSRSSVAHGVTRCADIFDKLTTWLVDHYPKAQGLGKGSRVSRLHTPVVSILTVEINESISSAPLLVFQYLLIWVSTSATIIFNNAIFDVYALRRIVVRVLMHGRAYKQY